jgi:hypothetical protein
VIPASLATIAGTWGAVSDQGDLTYLNLIHLAADGTEPADLTRGEMEGRRQAVHAVEALKHFMPGCEGAKLRNFGMTLGIRDTRKIDALYNMTAADVRGSNRFGLIEADQPVLADDVIRGASDVVALVVAESEQAAREGARRVVLDLIAEAPLTDELSLAVGGQYDYWMEEKRSGEVVAGVANYPDYLTARAKAFADVRYSFGGFSLWYHLEYLNKDLNSTDDRLDQPSLHIIRSVAMVSASF